MKFKDQYLLENIYQNICEKYKQDKKVISFEELPEEVKKDATIQDYQDDYNFILKSIGENEILEILDEKGITEEDISLWRGTNHYKKLKKDIQKNGIKVPAIGYEGIHRMLVALELGISLPYYQPVAKI